MSTTKFVILAIQVFNWMILVNQVSSADYSALLSLLYKRAAAVDRPLIVVIDSNLLKSDSQSHKELKPLESIVYDKIGNRAPISTMLQKKKKSLINLPYKTPKIYDIEKKLHHTLLPMQKRMSREKEMLRSPIIRNLLRISNTLRCEARNECEDTCNNRYTGNKNNKCRNNCVVKYECEEEQEDNDCDECEANSCGDDSCTGSTKGYAVTDPPVGCPECK